MMSLESRLAKMIVDAQADIVSKALNGGSVEFMTGDRPEEVEGPANSEQVLGTCRLAEVAFGKPVNGAIIANPAAKSIAVRTGEPTWVRCRSKDGAVVMDGTVGTSNANCIIKVDMFVKGQTLDVTGFKYVVAKRF
jgi:hypothetical protein